MDFGIEFQVEHIVEVEDSGTHLRVVELQTAITVHNRVIDFAMVVEVAPLPLVLASVVVASALSKPVHTCSCHQHFFFARLCKLDNTHES